MSLKFTERNFETKDLDGVPFLASVLTTRDEYDDIVERLYLDRMGWNFRGYTLEELKTKVTDKGRSAMDEKERKALEAAKAKARTAAESDEFKKRNRKPESSMAGKAWREGTSAMNCFRLIHEAGPGGATVEEAFKAAETKDWYSSDNEKVIRSRIAHIAKVAVERKIATVSDEGRYFSKWADAEVKKSDTAKKVVEVYKGYEITEGDAGTFEAVGENFTAIPRAKRGISLYIKKNAK